MMFANGLGFILGIMLLSGLQFAGARIYLNFSKRITVPMSTKSNIAIGIAWLLMAAFICLVGVLGIRSVNFFEISINRAIGICPVVFGFAASILRYKSDWQEFYQKFQHKR